MTKEDFKQWRSRLGLSQHQAAERLALARSTIARYEAGEDIPLVVELACQRLEDLNTVKSITAQAKKANAPPSRSALKKLMAAQKRLTSS